MDIELYYTEKGEGEPFIMLHGNVENGSVFEKEIDYFSKKYRVIAIDTRGHGRSPMGEEPFSLYQFAEDLKDFMDEHEIKRANILGFSDGGNIALIFASKYPERVVRLIANGSNTKPSGMKFVVHAAIRMNYILYSILSAFSQKYVQKKMLMKLMLDEPHISAEELGNISAPSLVLVGTNDLIKEKESRYIQKNIPNSEIVFVLGNHFIVKNNVKDYIYAVEHFLRK